MTHKGRVQVKTAMMLSIIFCLVLLGAFFAQADIYLDNSPSEFIVEDVAHQQSAPVYQTSTTSKTGEVNFWTKNIKVISCNSESFEIYLENTYNSAVRTHLSSSLDWITFSETTVFLEPHQTKSVLAWSKAPCGKSAAYKNKLTFITEKKGVDDIKYLTQEIVAEKVNNLQVRIENINDYENPTVPQEFVFEIRNKGPFSETYAVSILSNEEFATSTINQIVIPSGETQKVSIFANFPVDFYGEFPIDVKVSAIQNKMDAEFTLLANINQYYPFEIAGPNSIAVCQDGNGLTSTFTLKNAADVANNYDLTIYGPEYTTYEGDYLSLKANQTGLIPVNFNPQSSEGWFAKEFVGNSSLKLVATSEYGDLTAQKDVAITVNRCYALNLEVPNYENTVCNADAAIPFEVTNTGNFNETIVVSLYTTLEGVARTDVAISDSLFILGANESKTINLFLNNNASAYIPAGNFEVTLISNLANKSKIYSETTLSLKKLSDTDCYSFSVQPKQVYVVSQENATAYAQVLDVINGGIRSSNYSLSLEKENQNSSSTITLNQSSVYLNAGETKTIGMTLDGTNLSGSEIVYIVGTTNNIAFPNRVKVHYNKTFNWWFWIILLLILIILLLVLFVIFAKKKPRNKSQTQKKLRERQAELLKKQKSTTSAKKTKEKNNHVVKDNSFWKWLLLILLLLLLIGILVFGIYYLASSTSSSVAGNETTTNQTSNQTITLEDNTTITAPGNGTEGNQRGNKTGTQTSVWSKMLSYLTDVFTFDAPKTTNTTVETAPENNQANQTNQTVSNNNVSEVNNTVDANTTISDTNKTKTNEASGNESQTESIWSRMWSFFVGSATDNETVNSTNTTDAINTTGVNESELIKSTGLEPTYEVVDPCPEVQAFLDEVGTKNISESFEYQIIPYGATLEINLSEVFYDPDGDQLVFSSEVVENAITLHDGGLYFITPDENFCGLLTTHFYAEDPSGAVGGSPEITFIVLPKNSGQNNLRILFVSILVLIILGLIIGKLLSDK